MIAFASALNAVKTGQSLSETEMADAMRVIMDGAVPDADLAKFLTLLAQRGETVDELTGAARVLREKSLTIRAPDNAVDCCGTGGDGIGTFNISTAVAIVAASCGVPVAKHGNRSASSQSGAADVLEALGINLDMPMPALEDALRRFNFAFLMAPAHHAAMRHVRAVRQSLKTRTIFNLLGPLANPAGTAIQMVGVYDTKWLRPMAETLQRLGARKAWIVHGRDGLDEISIGGATDIVRFESSGLTESTLHPADFGLTPSSLSELKGGDAQTNAAALRKLLKGEKSTYRDIVLANTAAVLSLAGNTDDLKQGVRLAADAIDSSAAAETLQRYAEFTKMVST